MVFFSPIQPLNILNIFLRISGTSQTKPIVTNNINKASAKSSIEIFLNYVHQSEYAL